MAEGTEGNAGQEGQQASQEVKLTDIEQRAQTQGWVPKDEWDGDPDQWRPAREFLDRGELFKKIEDQSRTLKEFKRTISDLAKHNEAIAKVEYERALASLKARKKEALDTGDSDAVIEIDERMAHVREASKNLPQVQLPATPAETNPIFQNWVDRNAWYSSSVPMKAFADKLGNDLAIEGLAPTEILARVEQEVKKEFAHKFNNPNRDKPGIVESSVNKKGGKESNFQLSDDERRAMQRFVKTIPGYTEDKYISELKKIKGVS